MSHWPITWICEPPSLYHHEFGLIGGGKQEISEVTRPRTSVRDLSQGCSVNIDERDTAREEQGRTQ